MYKLLVFCLTIYSPTLLFSHSLCLLPLTSVLEQKAGAHLKTHTHPLRLVLMNTLFLGRCPRPGLWHWLMPLTWQSCQWKWQIHFAGFIHRLPTEPKNPRLCHHHITTHRLPPDWLLPSRPVPARGDLVPGLSLATSRQTWQFMTCLCVGLNIQRERLTTRVFRIQYVFLSDRGVSPFWKERILYWTQCSRHGNRYGAMVRLYFDFAWVYACLVQGKI